VGGVPKSLYLVKNIFAKMMPYKVFARQTKAKINYHHHIHTTRKVKGTP
jgi:hypothetical protein